MHSLRYAHCEGFTDMCFTETGKCVTTGEDGDVRIWEGFDDLDNTSFRVADKCFAIAYSAGKIYVSDETNELKKYDLETNEFQGVITSFTLPITCISINKTNTSLVCGSSDFAIHLVDLITLKYQAFIGHEAPILSVCFDPLNKYFISSSCDSTARFWSVNNLNMVKTVNSLHPKSNDFNDSPSWCRIAWHRDGGLIAIPCQKEIQFYERESWILKFKINLTNEVNPNEDFIASIVCFSPDGKYVLATTNTQMIFVHSIINKSMVYKYSYNKKSKITALVWNPINHSEILYCDIKGNMGQIKPIIKDPMNESDMQTSNILQRNSNNDDLKMDQLLELLHEDESTNDSTKSCSAKSKKNDSNSVSKKRKRLNDDDEQEDEVKKEMKPKNKEAFDGDDDMHLNLDDDDDNEFESLEKLKAKTYDSVKKEMLGSDDGYPRETNQDDKKMEEISTYKLVNRKTEEQHVPFQPSSTPINLPERYMVWNSIGVITQFNKEDDESIEIEFHNATYHHAIHLKNQYGYTMADMSKEAIVLASPGSKNNDDEAEINPVLTSSMTSQSKMTCILLNSCDTAKEWNVDMLKKESIKCLAVSRFLVACATNRKFIRIFNLSGTQKEILCVNGNPLCISAYDNTIFVCYSNSNIIGYSIYSIDFGVNKKSLPEHGHIPISDNAKIVWIGFSEEGNPYCCDSNGYLYTKCLTVSSKNVWTPISWLRAGLNHKSDNFWLIGIAERNQMVKAILCRGSKHPNVLPRPNLTTLTFNVPLTDPESEKSKLEQEFWKNKYLSISTKNYDLYSGNLDIDQEDLEERVDKFDNTARETLMKLFMLACKNNKEQRAYEIATIMDLDAIQLAIKYATKTRALMLAQNMNILIEKKSEMGSQLKQVEEYVITNEEPVWISRECEREDVESIRPSIDEANEINLDDNVTQKIESQAKASSTESQSISTFDSTLKTPNTILLTTTRINPFAKNSAKISQSPLFSTNVFNSNETPKSVLNEIEDKLNKKANISGSKDKDNWKPTPTRKLTKSKVSGNTPIGSFFNK